ncbi:coil containing protein [Vibrio phage 1.133.O._10N.222.51.E4]|nr:coil containing protein [Vibrio phage 1.133.O._10N.222.51.E4]
MEIITKKEAKERGLKRYFTGKPCKHGHVAERTICSGHCCVCGAERVRKYYEQNKGKIAEKDRKYREQNKDVIAEKKRKYHQQNKEVIAEKRRKHYEQNKEVLAERVREYYEQNRDKVAEKNRKYREQNREVLAEKSRNWLKANPEQAFIRQSLRRIQNNWKGGRAKAEKLMGYTREQLREHIELQFKEGMSWDNRSEWHIDHIKPVSVFIKEGITDPSIINALDNLQPLWAHENQSKSAKWDEK